MGLSQWCCSKAFTKRRVSVVLSTLPTPAMTWRWSKVWSTNTTRRRSSSLLIVARLTTSNISKNYMTLTTSLNASMVTPSTTMKSKTSLNQTGRPWTSQNPSLVSWLSLQTSGSERTWSGWSVATKARAKSGKAWWRTSSCGTKASSLRNQIVNLRKSLRGFIEIVEA